MTPREAQAAAIALQTELRSLASRSGVTVQRLVDDSRVSKATVDQMRKRPLNLTSIVALADAMGCEIVIRPRAGGTARGE